MHLEDRETQFPAQIPPTRDMRKPASKNAYNQTVKKACGCIGDALRSTLSKLRYKKHSSSAYEDRDVRMSNIEAVTRVPDDSFVQLRKVAHGLLER